MIKCTLAPFLALVAMAATSGAGCAPAEPAKHLIWEIAGASNHVYLLGSVHLLREEDYPLPPVYDRVYREAEKLVMELDMDDLDLVRLQQLMMRSGMIDGDASLETLLGEQRWSKAKSIADTLDLRLDMLAAVEPWFAALTVVELEMMKLGFDSSLGIEAHFLQRARDDRKSIEGLESPEQQIAFFDGLPMDTQARFFLKALEDAQSIQTDIDKLIVAWRGGNADALGAELSAGFDGFPEVYQALVVRRNLAWSEDIEDLLDDEDDYLVIVGALHLIGDDSVIRLLAKKGYRARQL